MSTNPRFGEITATTLLPMSNRSPPVVATSSSAALSLTLLPRRVSKFVEAKAIAPAFEMRPPASIAAYKRILRTCELLKEHQLTHAKSKRVFRALHASSIPIPTVTLCARRVVIELSGDNGGPGRLYPKREY